MLDWFGRVRRALLTGSAFFVGACGGERVLPPRRALGLEPLEPRLPMSAAGLVPVGTQPDGGLSGKIAYIHPGHGWIVGDGFQRSEVTGTEMIEDLGNYDHGSIMHYPAKAFSKNGQDTIRTRDGTAIGQRNGLSRSDIESVRKMYPNIDWSQHQ